MDEQTNTPKDWRLLAERDLSVADYLAGNMRPVPAEIIAFLCQQSTEKYLKGALVILGEEPPYIHDLDRLCKLAEKHCPSFTSLSSLKRQILDCPDNWAGCIVFYRVHGVWYRYLR